ncbi:MAG: PHP domain-containing protein [Candidatus Helarchaeota archaeon]
MIDLHIHTTYSDGQATISEVFNIASQKKLDYFAISDHFTTTSKQYIIPTLNLDNIDTYIEEINENKKKNPNNCFLGIEIDCESNFEDIEELPLEKFELFNFEDVFSINLLNKVCNLIIDKKLKGIFCLAHPSIHLYDGHYPVNAKFIKKQLAPILRDFNIAFELNSRYTRRWLDSKLKILVLMEEGVRISVGSDAHSKFDIGEVFLQYNFLKDCGMINKIIKLEKLEK